MEIAALNSTRMVHDESIGVTYHIQLDLGGDLPWLMAMLGKKSINFEDHVLFTAEIAAMLTHTSPAVAFERKQHQDFICPAVGCTWGDAKGRLVTLQSREDFKQHLATLAGNGKSAAVKRALTNFARAHHGFNFDTPCLFKFSMVCPDPLHAYLNVVDAVLSYGIRDRILIDSSDDAELKEVKREACTLINAACHTHRVRLVFSTDRKEPMPKVNGNVWKEMMKPGFYPAILEALSLIFQCQTPLQQSSSEPYVAAAATDSAGNAASDSAAAGSSFSADPAPAAAVTAALDDPTDCAASANPARPKRSNGK
eukprot:699432-Pleurochrysis_carterae.AAC.1